MEQPKQTGEHFAIATALARAMLPGRAANAEELARSATLLSTALGTFRPRTLSELNMAVRAQVRQEGGGDRNLLEALARAAERKPNARLDDVATDDPVD